jgi:hypothetical protein
MHRGDEDDVVNAAVRYLKIRYIKRLGVDVAVYTPREQLAELP